MDIDISTLPTPSYLVDQQLLIKNLELLSSVKERTGCKILLAQKAFSMFSVYPLIAKYLDGVTSSGVMEARLGYEEMGKEIQDALLQVRQQVRDEAIAAAAPKASVTCPFCGAATTPDARGCCEFCGCAINE